MSSSARSDGRNPRRDLRVPWRDEWVRLEAIKFSFAKISKIYHNCIENFNNSVISPNIGQSLCKETIHGTYCISLFYITLSITEKCRTGFTFPGKSDEPRLPVGMSQFIYEIMKILVHASAIS